MADWPYSTARWQRLRKAKLSESPLCETCERRGRRIIAEHVDHVVSIASGGHAFPAMDGLRSLCPPCHSIKTNALDRAGGKGVAIKGCDVNGLPLDPDHPFLQDAGREGCNNDQVCRRRLSEAGASNPAGARGNLSFRSLARPEARPGGDRRGLAGDRARNAAGANEPLVGGSPLQGWEAVDQGPAGTNRMHLVRDWGV